MSPDTRLLIVEYVPNGSKLVAGGDVCLVANVVVLSPNGMKRWMDIMASANSIYYSINASTNVTSAVSLAMASLSQGIGVVSRDDNVDDCLFMQVSVSPNVLSLNPFSDIWWNNTDVLRPGLFLGCSSFQLEVRVYVATRAPPFVVHGLFDSIAEVTCNVAVLCPHIFGALAAEPSNLSGVTFELLLSGVELLLNGVELLLNGVELFLKRLVNITHVLFIIHPQSRSVRARNNLSRLPVGILIFEFNSAVCKSVGNGRALWNGL